jgi:O-antigen/teichoic acid export membrane protein
MGPPDELTLTAPHPGAPVPHSQVAKVLRQSHLAYVLLSVGTSALLFLYVVIPARGLAPDEYSRFASLFSVVVLLGVIFTAVQTYVAGSLVSAGAQGRTTAVRTVGVRVARWCLTLAGVLTLTAPLVSRALRTSLASVLLVGLLSTLMLVWAAMLGVLQGDQRFVALGAVNAAQALLRLSAVAAVISFQSVDLILIATVVSMLPALILAAIVARPFGSSGLRPELHEVFRLQPSLPTFIVAFVVGFPTVGDVVLARASLTSQAAGDMAVIAIVGRVSVFFAVMIAVVAYPRFVQGVLDPRGYLLLLRATGLVAAVAVPVTAVVLWQRSLTLVVLCGQARPSALALIPWYLLASLIFALAIPGCFYHLARARRQRETAVLLPAIIAMIAFGMLVHAPLPFVIGLVVAAAALALTVAGLVLADVVREGRV